MSLIAKKMEKRISEDISIIKAYGTPHQAGSIYGRQARDKILKNIAKYKAILQSTHSQGWEKLREKTKKGSEEIRTYNEEAYQVMEGIAEGSGAPLEDIMVLNYRYELLFSSKSSCTSLGISSKDLSLIAQNWDLYQAIEDGIVNLEYKVNADPKVFTQVEAGSLAHRGLNSDGLALCINALRSKDDRQELAVPLISVVGWSILNSNNLTKAFDWIQNARRSASINFMVAKHDLIVDIEITPREFDYIEPDDHGQIVHTNHFLCDRFKNLEGNISPCSWTRLLRANQLVKDLRREQSVEKTKLILRDHFDYPYSICRHVTGEPGIAGTSKTLASTIIDTSRFEVHYTIGNPCLSEYRTVKVLR